VDLFVVCPIPFDQNLYITRMKIMLIHKIFLPLWYILNIIYNR